jgi:hypothetical protein
MAEKAYNWNSLFYSMGFELRFYNFMFCSYPIVVIGVPDRTGCQHYADITSATRE